MSDTQNNSLNVASLRADQRRRWHSEEQVRVEGYLVDYPGLASDSEGLLDLIYNEVLLREESGEKPTAAEYVARFPNLAVAIRDQFEVHEVIAGNPLLTNELVRHEPVDHWEYKSTSKNDPVIWQTADSNISLARDGCLTETSNRYVLSKEIACGGMGIIYRATDKAFGREVAIKVLKDKFGTSSEAARRFADEAQITGQLQHPSIPPAHDLGILPDRRLFLAMKLIRGRTLDALLTERPAPSYELSRFVAVFEQVCQAIAYAHAHQVIHRDLKPANVMVGNYGEVQVMDWGLAKVLGGRIPDSTDADDTRKATEIHSLRDSDLEFTQAGSVLGTPSFMPPEQAIGAIDKIDERSDVFGLGGILCVILTGRAPFAEDTAESSQQAAAKGKVADAFKQLDACRADPELVSLCKQCLAPEKEDRPADAREVARVVAELRIAADERAKQAELERVRLEGEQAAQAARSAERRKRRWMVVMAAAVLAVTVVGALSAFLLMQRRANAELSRKNGELAKEKEKVQTRFELAQKAIATFHTGVSEDVLLRSNQFNELRTHLLKEAAGFYRDLEGLLKDQSDVRSRKLLSKGYFELGVLTSNIGSKPEALVIHCQSLAIKRELAEADGADLETRLDLALSLSAVGNLLRETGKRADALVAYGEVDIIATALEEEFPTDAVHAQLAANHHNIGLALNETGKPAEALQSYQKALNIWQKLADNNPSVTQYQKDLALVRNSIGYLLKQTGQPQEALQSFQKALDIRQKLANDNPTVTQYQRDLANSHNNIGIQLRQMGRPAEALQSYQKGVAIQQMLAEVNPTISAFQDDLALTHNNIGNLLSETAPADALKSYEQALEIRQKLSNDNPTVSRYQGSLALTHTCIGMLMAETGQPVKAMESHQKALVIQQKLAATNSTVTQFQRELALIHYNIGLALAEMGKPELALQSHQKARGIQQKLTDSDPTVTVYRRDLALTDNGICIVLIEMGNLAHALQFCQNALGVQLKLVAANPAVRLYQTEQAMTYNNLGRLYARQQHYIEAFAAIEKGLELRQKLANADPKNTQYANQLGCSYASRGWVHLRAGHLAEAVSDINKSLGIWNKDKPMDNETRFELCRALAVLTELGANAKSDLSAAEAAAYADQAVAALVELIKSGWAKPNELREADFIALRAREDFRKLVLELVAKQPESPPTATKPRPKE